MDYPAIKKYKTPHFILKTGFQHFIHVTLPAGWGSHIQIFIKLAQHPFKGQAAGLILAFVFISVSYDLAFSNARLNPDMDPVMVASGTA